MRNHKETIMHDPDQGVYLFVHTPTRLEFAVIGRDPSAYLKDCVMFPDRKDCDPIHHPNHLTVLKDFKVNTRYNFAEFVFRCTCPGQMKWLLEFIKAQQCLEVPEIAISNDMFGHLYRLDMEGDELVIEKDKGYVFAIHEETGIKVAADAGYFNNPKVNIFDKFKRLELDRLEVNKYAYLPFPPGFGENHLLYAQSLKDISKAVEFLGDLSLREPVSPKFVVEKDTGYVFITTPETGIKVAVSASYFQKHPEIFKYFEVATFDRLAVEPGAYVVAFKGSMNRVFYTEFLEDVPHVAKLLEVPLND